MDLFDIINKDNAPLAQRMRPKTLDEFVGQSHIVGKNSLLRRAILTDTLGSCIFYGPPGCGKTTLAHIIANTTHSNFVQLNAVSSGISDAKKVIEDAKNEKERYGIKHFLSEKCRKRRNIYAYITYKQRNARKNGVVNIVSVAHHHAVFAVVLQQKRSRRRAQPAVLFFLRLVL